MMTTPNGMPEGSPATRPKRSDTMTKDPPRHEGGRAVCHKDGVYAPAPAQARKPKRPRHHKGGRVYTAPAQAPDAATDGDVAVDAMDRGLPTHADEGEAVKTESEDALNLRFFKDLKEALEALPEKKLGAGRMFDTATGQVCAIGAMLRHKDALDDYLACGSHSQTAALLGYPDGFGTCGLTQALNDRRTGTEEGRWLRMHAWAVDRIEAAKEES